MNQVKKKNPFRFIDSVVKAVEQFSLAYDSPWEWDHEFYHSWMISKKYINNMFICFPFCFIGHQTFPWHKGYIIEEETGASCRWFLPTGN